MNYLSYLTDEELESMLNKMNFRLVELEDRNGDPLPKISRNMERNKQTIFVRCENIKIEKEQDKFNSALSKTASGRNLLMINSMISKNYSPALGFIIIKDFEFSTYFPEDVLFKNEAKEDKALTFAKMFKEKLSEISVELGKKYVNDYNANVRKHNNQLAKKQKEEQKQDSEHTN